MSDYEIFIEQVKRKTRIDLSLYKEAQMKRRLTSLYRKRGYRNFVDYFDAIDRDPELLDEFLDRMTINVSEFYRNPKQWDLLDRVVVPELLERSSRFDGRRAVLVSDGAIESCTVTQRLDRSDGFGPRRARTSESRVVRQPCGERCAE